MISIISLIFLLIISWNKKITYQDDDHPDLYVFSTARNSI